MEFEKENKELKEKNDELYFLNKKLDEFLRNANEKLKSYEHGGSQIQIESTNIDDQTVGKVKLINVPNQSRLSFNTKFLATASPDQVKSFKQSLIEGKLEQASILFDVSEYQDDSQSL